MASCNTIPAAELISCSSDAGGRAGIPLVGLGTAAFPFAPETTKPAILHAIELGYRHFDTASIYQSEQALGEAIEEALLTGRLHSRSELFITSKLWCTDAHPDRVLPAIRNTLRNLKMEYLDLYLIHWPMCLKPGAAPFPVKAKDILPLDLKSVWEAMEECQRLGLTRSIGVSNFNTTKLQELLHFAKIPPAVNQVEMNPAWQQEKLREFCKGKGIHITAYSPLGGQTNPLRPCPVMDSPVLRDIANSKGKTVAQVSLRWVHEQGVSVVVKSFNKARLKENVQIFGWELSEEDRRKISLIPQSKKVCIEGMLSISPQECELEPHELSEVDVFELE
ncbi:deoxymugineic acid synthase 1-like [Zingiber officinale]|uniref:NADP-dependent oxidoreductase domain-containing protein n=1 Tax=Zingiber officinale TaxID=94328 RepID=A0A8J5C7Y6_ZINOF|nr:deoxymugineic acid synthase 1-like [Zingiber officinale]KAG6474322.1 hypothetical protein ZIOFF_068248 [Zingiber officinale]